MARVIGARYRIEAVLGSIPMLVDRQARRNQSGDLLMSGPDHETFETITRRAEDRRRTELTNDYGNENAGRNTGRMKRHLPGEAAPDAIRKRRDEDARRMMSALEQLLLDPIYRAKYEAFGLFLSDAENKADNLIEKAESKLAEIDAKISAAIESAPKLNGKAIFRYADGRVIDEDGEELSSDQVEGIVWPDGSMSAEEFTALRESREQADATLRA